MNSIHSTNQNKKMNVLLVNGSPKQFGCTFTALKEVERGLNEDGISTEIFWPGNNPIAGCMGCGFCTKEKKCFRDDDNVNAFINKASSADGFIFGSPVHFAAASGAITSFLDRAFMVNRRGFEGQVLKYKPGAAIVSCRRGGATSAFDQINKYFSISSMPIVSSIYWNLVHGNTPEEIIKDLEGMKTMFMLGKNMAWLLKNIEAGKAVGIDFPNT